MVSHEVASATLQIPQDRVNTVVAKALSSLPVQDLTVENPPLEEVMSELFSRSRAAREAGEERGGDGAAEAWE